MSEADGIRRETVAGVLAVAVGLAVVALSVGSIFGGRTRELPDQGRALIDETFASVGELPFGFDVVRGLELVGGQRIVLLADPSGPLPEPPTIERKEGRGGFGGGHGGGGHGGGRKEPSIWLDVVEGESGSPPIEAALAWFSMQKADGVLKAQFGVGYKDLADVGEEGESVPVEGGYLDWHGYEAPWVRVREFYKKDDEPTFHDTVRVNLSLGKTPCVLYLRWAEGLPGDKAGAERFLAVLEPRA